MSSQQFPTWEMGETQTGDLGDPHQRLLGASDLIGSAILQHTLVLGLDFPKQNQTLHFHTCVNNTHHTAAHCKQPKEEKCLNCVSKGLAMLIQENPCPRVSPPQPQCWNPFFVSQ